LAWLAWQEEKLEDVVALAAEAAALYRADPNPNFHWKWTYLWPLIAMHLRHGDGGRAVGAANELLGSFQTWMPRPVEAELAAACEAWERRKSTAAKSALSRALELAHESRYF
jgi:hypothetical protein